MTLNDKDIKDGEGRVIAVCGKRYQDGYLAEIGELLERLVTAHFVVKIRRRFAEYLEQKDVALSSEVMRVDAFPKDAECVLSIGGDGTILKTAEWVGGEDVPIMGINTGHLGYLTSYSLRNPAELVNIILLNEEIQERHGMVEVSSSAMPADMWPYALNEVSVLKAETASMVTVRAEINGYYLADYQADGLLISTPTGSTAYNMAVGGPIMQPTLESWVLSPIAPHSLTMRPLVVGAQSEIRLSASSRSSSCRVSLDGRSFKMKCEEQDIVIRRAPFDTVVMRRPSETFASILRSKLLWSV